MLCTYHFIQIVDVSSECVIRLFSHEYQTDTDDFKVFFRSRQADLEACSVELKNGDVYFWSRYNEGDGWEYIGKAAIYGHINLTNTKALLASTIPSEYVHFDLELATQHFGENWEAFSWTAKK